MAMLIFGRKRTTIDNIEEVLLKCPSCETHQFADLMVYSEYFHFYYVPMWPIDKEAVSYCKKCGLKRVRPFDKDFSGDYIELKSKFRHKLFLYTGVSIIVMITLIAIIT